MKLTFKQALHNLRGGETIIINDLVLITLRSINFVRQEGQTTENYLLTNFGEYANYGQSI